MSGGNWSIMKVYRGGQADVRDAVYAMIVGLQNEAHDWNGERVRALQDLMDLMIMYYGRMGEPFGPAKEETKDGALEQ